MLGRPVRVAIPVVELLYALPPFVKIKIVFPYVQNASLFMKWPT